MQRLRVPAMVLAILSGISMLRAGAGHASTLTVCPGCALSTISAAVATASPGDTISIGAGSYNEKVTLNKSLSLTGTSGTVIDGTGLAAPLVVVAAGASAYIVNLTIRNGADAAGSGGGILNQGSLTLDHVTVSGNHADSGSGGGIDNTGTLTVRDSTIRANTASAGGGIANSASLTVLRTTIGSDQVNSGNVASGDGAGIWSTGHASIQDSTLAGNCAGGTQGAGPTVTCTGATGRGGGLYSNSAAIVFNSTIAENQAPGGGGVYNDAGDIYFTNSTISANVVDEHGGGGIESAAGGIFLTNTILADNTVTGPPPAVDPNCSGILSDGSVGLAAAGNNVVGDVTGCDVSGLTHADQIGVTSTALRLGPLQDNGGPTFTMFPQPAPDTTGATPGSAAIDAGNDVACMDASTVNGLDQRGMLRPSGRHCDVGAVEGGLLAYVSTTGTDTGSCPKSAPCLTIGYAYGAVRNTGYILVAPGMYPHASISANNKNVDIVATGTAPVTLDAANNGFWLLDNTANVFVLSGLTIQGSAGAAIQVGLGGSVEILHSAITGNGGGILNNGSVIVSDSTVSGNGSTVSPKGGINSGGNLTVMRSTVDHNIGCNGAGISSTGPLSIVTSTISNNSATATNCSQGGGVYLGKSIDPVQIVNSTIYGNTAVTAGGIADICGCAMTILDSTITGNSVSGAGARGGGIYDQSVNADITLTNSIVAGNTAPDVVGSGPDCAATVSDGGHNMLGGNDSCTGLTDGVHGNHVGLGIAAIVFSALQNNGGPTNTVMPLPGNVAIGNGGTAACVSASPSTGGLNASPGGIDQRGLARPTALCDIGAVDTGAHSGSVTLPPGGPGISSVSPASVTAGSPATSIYLAGQGFDATSRLQWNGSTTGIITTFDSATELEATIPQADLATAGTPQITVLNTDTGAVSNPQSLYVTKQGTGVSSYSSDASSSPGGSAGISITDSGSGNPIASIASGGEGSISSASFTSNPGPPTNNPGWQPVSNVSGPDADGNVTVTINSTSTPNLSQLTGSWFHGGGSTSVRTLRDVRAHVLVPAGPANSFYDMHLSNGNTFSSVTITDSVAGSSNLFYYNPSVTAAHLSYLRVAHSHEFVSVRWRMAEQRSVIGFAVWSGSRSLTHGLIPVRTSRSYLCRVPYHGGGQLSLHVLLRGGGQWVVPLA